MLSSDSQHKLAVLWQGGRVWWFRWGRWVEVTAATAFIVNDLRSNLLEPTLIKAVARGAVNTVRIGLDDPATVIIAGGAALKLLLGFGPVALWVARLPWYRRLWLIPPAVIAGVIAVLSFASCLHPSRWVALVVLSATGFALSRVRWLGLTALLPLVVFFEPAVNHVFGRQLWQREALVRRCQENDGTRPENGATHYAPTYYALTPSGDDSLLLTGVGRSGSRIFEMQDTDSNLVYGSYWVSMHGRELSLGARSEATGNLWRGCLIDGTVWFASYRYLIGAQRVSGGNERIDQIPIWVDNGDFDKGNIACDPRKRAVYFGDLLAGRLGQYQLARGTLRDFDLGGMAIQIAVRSDGRVLAVDSARLSVFDPEAWQLESQVAVGAAIVHFDSCPADGAVVVADFMGRIREMVPTGVSYRFAWGLSLPAPRRIAYSPDCRFIGVSSADDTSVFVVSRETHSVVRTFHVGPALRDLLFLGPNELAAVDACTIERLAF